LSLGTEEAVVEAVVEEKEVSRVVRVVVAEAAIFSWFQRQQARKCCV